MKKKEEKMLKKKDLEGSAKEELEEMECTPIDIIVGDKKIAGYACKMGDSVNLKVVSKKMLKKATERALK